MIPKKLVDFVHGPRVMFLGTRSATLRPSFSWVCGAVADESGTITFFVPDIEADQVLRDLEDNGQIALTMHDGISHESYQFKGKSAELRPSDERENAIQDIWLSKLVAQMASVGMGEEVLNGYVTKPSTAVTLKVEEIFVQTPGPGAEDKIDMTALSD